MKGVCRQLIPMIRRVLHPIETSNSNQNTKKYHTVIVPSDISNVLNHGSPLTIYIYPNVFIPLVGLRRQLVLNNSIQRF